MSSCTLQIFFACLIFSNFRGITAEDTDLDPTTTEPPEVYLDDHVARAARLYSNFTDSVFEVLSELGANNTDSDTDDDDSGSIASLLGISSILASTRKQAWRLSYPIFNYVMEKISYDILEALDTVIWDMVNINFTNALFVNPTLNASWGSKYLNPLELFHADFEDDDATIPIINENIFNITDGLLQTNYIQDGIIIPSSTLAVVINVVKTKSKWPSPLTSVGKRYFNGNREMGNMLQMRGAVKYIEDDGEFEIMLYFDQNEKSGLAIRMPKDIDNDRAVANIEKLPLVQPSNVTIILPQLKYTLRSTYNLDDANLTNCQFRKERNMLQILDVLTYVNLATDVFQVVSVSGAQVVNVHQLIEEIHNHTESMKKDGDSGESATKPSAKKSRTDDSDVADADYSEPDDNPQSSERKLDNALLKGKMTEDNEIVPEKVIVINKPFTWMMFDDFVVPIVAGVVTSLKTPEDAVIPHFTLLGTEGNGVSPYLQCFKNEPE